MWHHFKYLKDFKTNNSLIGWGEYRVISQTQNKIGCPMTSRQGPTGGRGVEEDMVNVSLLPDAER